MGFLINFEPMHGWKGILAACSEQLERNNFWRKPILLPNGQRAVWPRRDSLYPHESCGQHKLRSLVGETGLGTCKPDRKAAESRKLEFDCRKEASGDSGFRIANYRHS
jgi:hypothetical protein